MADKPETIPTHSPTPWYADGNSIMSRWEDEEVQVASMSRTTWCGSSESSDKTRRFRALSESDLDLILRAVNSHDELLAAAKAALRLSDSHITVQHGCCGLDEAISRDLRAAIEKAEVKP